ncbi:ABC transporter C family member 3 [Quillaja saponaria]|uniref:ABC-type xenobiotic transporter n=1 Tax=Quillaja saponaria TaxID=32244 RepID=A0AAD7LT16_QUISA|nr:ABC transporter C family member 3 [Quillaja saponaria]
MLANVPLGKLQEKFQDKLMESKDKRMKATSEILRNMWILKLQGWEMKFLSKIIELRKTEARWLKKYVYSLAMTTFAFWGAPTFISVVTFGACMLKGIPLESAQTKVSLDRIASFLRLDDLQSDVIEKLPRGSSDTAIEVVDGNFSWDTSSSGQTLKNINFKVFHGMKIAVCGTVGSGKSSLLSCVLGELPKITGTVKTVIGERGINLSGGQKQRIQIARALYQDADIYLFDDPFSAVDAHTGSHLFKECLLGLLSSKTVIYITHQVEFLPAADLILVLKDGRVTQSGKYNNILHSGTDFLWNLLVHTKKLCLHLIP